jgi:SAM-dependent methyltransferase
MFTALARAVGRALLPCLAAGAVSAAQPGVPSVPYVPTPHDVVERMLQIAKVTPADYVIDLGSGDGRIVIAAAQKFGARGFGVDLNPERIAEANANARKAGVADKVTFQLRDLFETDLSDATVITMYLLPRVNLELRPKLLKLRPGTRLVSHDFDMGDWKPDVHVQVESKEKYGSVGGTSDIYFWVVPAQAGGTWQWQLTVAGKPETHTVTLAQKYQEISGSATVAGRSVKLQKPVLSGDLISFSYAAEVDGAPVRYAFSGRVDGNTITGTVSVAGKRVQAQLEWVATRTAASAIAPAPRLAMALAGR